jgi:hypothetical protein
MRRLHPLIWGTARRHYYAINGGHRRMIPWIQKEPAVVAGALLAVLQALKLFNVIDINGDQLAGINIAVVAVLSLFVRQSVTPTAAPKLASGTEVKVKGTDDVVVVQPTPPGPVGYEDPNDDGPG